MSNEGSLRRHDRSEKSSPIQLIWKDRTGVDKYVTGRTLDISPSGLRIEISEQIEKQTYVTMQCAALDLHVAGCLPPSGLVKQEQIDLQAFLGNRFGRYYGQAATRFNPSVVEPPVVGAIEGDSHVQSDSTAFRSA